MTPKLIYYNISNNTTAFTTTREGGCSIGRYASFNANHYCGDTPEHVAANRNLLCTELGIEQASLIIPHQTHGTNIKNVTHDFLALDEASRTEELEAVDALVTQQRNTAICVSTADCVPLLVYDTRHHVAAAIHAGWRGTAARIAELTLQEMNRLFGTQGTECKAVIGPSISVRNFEVGEEVYEAFKTAGFDMNDIARKYEKWHINLWQCNRIQLISQGLAPSNIHTADICTYQDSDRFFSARKLGIKSGRMLTGIILR